MKLEAVLLCLLLSILVVLGVLAAQDEQPHSVGLSHPDHPAMAMGGEGSSRHDSIQVLAALFAILQVALFTGLLLLGLRRPGESLMRYRGVIAGGFLVMVVFLLLFRSYSQFAHDPLATGTVLGFPTPTAWMLLGVWWMPLILVGLYYRRFDQWVFSAKDRQRVDQLLTQLQMNAASDRSQSTDGEG